MSTRWTPEALEARMRVVAALGAQSTNAVTTSAAQRRLDYVRIVRAVDRAVISAEEAVVLLDELHLDLSRPAPVVAPS
jgi:hypothetical protein